MIEDRHVTLEWLSANHWTAAVDSFISTFHHRCSVPKQHAIETDWGLDISSRVIQISKATNINA
jgi:hypothetical protein